MNNSASMRMGLRVRRARGRARLSVRELARRAGLSVSYVYHIERGECVPSARIIEAIEAATGEVLL